MMLKEKKVHGDLKPSNILFTYTKEEKNYFGLTIDLYKTDIRLNQGTSIF